MFTFPTTHHKKAAYAGALVDGTRQLRLHAMIFALPAAIALASGAHASGTTDHGTVLRDVTLDFFDGEHHHYEYFAADGTSSSRSRDGATRRGKWYARDDGTVCIIHPDPNQSGCVFVIRGESRIEFHLVNGEVEGPFPFEAGDPHGLGG